MTSERPGFANKADYSMSMEELPNLLLATMERLKAWQIRMHQENAVTFLLMDEKASTKEFPFLLKSFQKAGVKLKDSSLVFDAARLMSIPIAQIRFDFEGKDFHFAVSQGPTVTDVHFDHVPGMNLSRSIRRSIENGNKFLEKGENSKKALVDTINFVEMFLRRFYFNSEIVDPSDKK